MSTSLLLTHLRNQQPTVPLTTLAAALAHHLAVEKPSPTPLAAAAVSSPFFLAYPHTHERLQGLVTAFRHAVYLKHQALVKSREEGWSFSRAVFSKNTDTALREWCREVLRGLQGGLAIVKLACCVGILLGLRQLGGTIKVSKVEDEVVISLAEVLDNYSSSTGEWEKDFWPDLQETTLSLTLMLASQSLPYVTPAKLNALPLSLLIRLLSVTISSAFEQGKLLQMLPKAFDGPSIHIDPSSSFSQQIKRVSTRPSMQSMPSLSKLMAVLLSTIIDSSKDGLTEALRTLDTFQDIAVRVEQDWLASQLSSAETDEDIAGDTKELCKTIWLLLKTLLFTTVMIAEGALESVIYANPQHHQQDASPHSLAQSTLQTLSHLSFVIAQFGGVTAVGTNEDPGFKELGKVFYVAVDVLCSGEKEEPAEKQNRCEDFAKDLIQYLQSFEMRGDVPSPVKHGKAAYTLACIEQVVPLLREQCLEKDVWPACAPYLSDPSHRGTYESAHSVVLSIFASHAQQHSNNSSKVEISPATGFVLKMVPFYSQCLIENSKDGHLSTPQLRLAYAALVRGAGSTSGYANELPQITGDSLAWYCVTLLIDAVRNLDPENEQTRERLHRLHLTMISVVSSLRLSLMLRLLEEIEGILVQLRERIDTVGSGESERKRRKELLDALFKEISEGVGDREKEAAMKWWYEHRETLDLRVERARDKEVKVEARL